MSIPIKKICSKCRVEKDADSFGRRIVKWRDRKYECLTARCKPCLCEAVKESYRKKHGPRIFSAGLRPDTKTCKGCGLDKSAANFSETKGKPRRDGSSAIYLNSYCIPCVLDRAKKTYYENIPRARETKARNYADNRERDCAYAQAYRADNKQRNAELDREYKQANRAKLTAAQNARYRINRKATPQCLSFWHHLQITELYEIAAAKSIQTGVKHHVDHVFPLRGKGFCGLNVPWNLQAIEATKNFRKWRNPPAEFAHVFWSAA